jgi:hypothetical protein
MLHPTRLVSHTSVEKGMMWFGNVPVASAASGPLGVHRICRPPLEASSATAEGHSLMRVGLGEIVSPAPRRTNETVRDATAALVAKRADTPRIRARAMDSPACVFRLESVDDQSLPAAGDPMLTPTRKPAPTAGVRPTLFTTVVKVPSALS